MNLVDPCKAIGKFYDMPKRLADGPVYDRFRNKWRVEHHDGCVDWYTDELDALAANQVAQAEWGLRV